MSIRQLLLLGSLLLAGAQADRSSFPGLSASVNQIDPQNGSGNVWTRTSKSPAQPAPTPIGAGARITMRVNRRS
jgi:phosphodiesterase/alkaline phosphatase D-like protein